MTPLDSDFRVTVIIPFFQYREGSLVSAVRSCLGQRKVEALSVIVVDDGSPLPARQELAELSDRENSRVSIIEQPNGGPGSARNRGLSALPDDTNVVAFLDSDDQWDPDHISNALGALAAGADFYFSDYLPLGSTVSTFKQCNLTPVTGQELGSRQEIYTYTMDLFDALLVKSPVGTSTVVYRRSVSPDIRFRTDFSYGEDVFFWMELAGRARVIAFSTRFEALYGEGVNIAAGATWGSSAHLNRTYYDFAFHRAIAQSFRLTNEQIRWNDSWMEEVAQSFVQSFLHLLRRSKPIDWWIMRCFVNARPKIILEIMMALFTIGWRGSRKHN
ncbi:glycosyltransferase family 2 protein [Rhodopila sp.]|uniref:glycosyltransferase family 2 protein n=1 Tax=Rhodopila sp. TaxID=2480087 RepID=UPI003D11204A